VAADRCLLAAYLMISVSRLDSHETLLISQQLLSHHMVLWLGYLVYFYVFVCTVTDFSAAEKDSGVKLRLLVRILSGMSFSHFGELWPRGGWDILFTSGIYKSHIGKMTTNRPWEKISRRATPTPVRVPYGGICVLLTHLFETTAAALQRWRAFRTRHLHAAVWHSVLHARDAIVLVDMSGPVAR